MSFDRAAAYYDKTRALGEDAQRALTALLSRELDGRTRTLEIGIGTGRIGVPLHAAGIPVTGIDLSRPMLDVLADKDPSLPLAIGDATLLPWSDGAFDSGIACHVFHLIPNWLDAVAELVRVMRPGARIVAEVGNWGHSGWNALQERLASEAGISSRFPGANSAEEVDGAFASHGATVRVLEVITDRRTLNYSELLESFASGQWSWTWAADEDTLRAATERTRAWAEGEYGDLDADVEHTLDTSWRTYDLA